VLVESEGTVETVSEICRRYGITHRAVAEEAVVPIAATTYYFASKEELIAEAFRLHAEKEARRVVAATRTIEKETTKYQLAD
jgi:DNA-binding transcriptional regulator YbjK